MKRLALVMSQIILSGRGLITNNFTKTGTLGLLALFILLVTGGCSDRDSTSSSHVVGTPVQPPFTQLISSGSQQETNAAQEFSGAMGVIQPNGGEVWGIGGSHKISWAPGNLGGEVRIMLYTWKPGSKYLADYYRDIESRTPNDGDFTWTISNDIPAGTKYKVAVQSRVNWDVYDFSDKYFQIKKATVASGPICYGNYVRRYPDLLAAYNATGGGQKIEAWGKAHYDAAGRAEGRVAPTGACGGGTSNGGGCYGDYVRRYPDLLAAYNATGGGQKIEAWGKAHYDAAGKWEGRTLGPGCGVSSSGDYNFLYKHNAFSLNGHTVRWPNRVIEVSGAKKASWRKAIQAWPGVTARFVPSTAKGIRIVYKDISSKACGQASYRWYSNGEMYDCELRINNNIHNMNGCNEDIVVSHEFGHCIGFMSHISTPGLMDPDCCEDYITSKVRNMIQLLYSLPPGTNINSRLTSRNSANLKRGGMANRYDPAGRKSFNRVISIYPNPR